MAEDEANQFTAEFLMPEADVKARLPRVNTLNQIVEAKRRWGVSVAALNYRLHKLGCSTAWQYRAFCIQINDRYRQSEPYGLPREQSIVWQKVMASLRSEGITKPQIAEALGLPVFEIENLLFQLANMQSIDGQGSGSRRSRAKLELVL